MAWTVEAPTIEFCPTCGSKFGNGKTAERKRCRNCGRPIYRNPIPMARVAVVDEDAVLLIEMGEGRDEGSWALPGGHIDADESPRAAAVRELEEETGIQAASNELSLIGDGFLAFEDGDSMVSFNYAITRDKTAGQVEAADDAAKARFWTRKELQETPPLVRASGIEQLHTALEGNFS